MGYSAGSTGELLWQNTWRDLLALSGILGGIHWRAALVGYLAGPTGWRDTRRDPLASYSEILSGILGGIHWRAGYSAGSTGEPLWRDTWRDPRASSAGLRIHWPAALAGYSAGSTRRMHWQAAGGILGGIHWRAALAGYSAGSTGEQL